MSSRTVQNVVVLMGGPSAEREVSLSTGRECAKALRTEGFHVAELDAGEDVVERLKALAPDVVFNALHGRWGEDGCIQGLLEWLRIPYTHSGVLASSTAIDKERTKALYRAHGLPVAESLLAGRDEIEAAHVMPPPYVVKPYNEGSSVGIYIVNKDANSPPKLAADAAQVLMVEAFAPGRELTCTVMGEAALGVTEILTDGWYDYEAKYAAGGSRHICPAEVPEEITEACRDYALRAHQALGCKGISRTDFRWDDSKGAEGIVLLETNTQPGMTPTSLSPEHAEHAGYSFGAFCRWIVEDASCGR
ncbi:D-alanine--D-alanine ligase [Vannielia litorea]|uniref:D-alanine--D-alanine ligase n=1 Tax=Vannielia litorea TaxID=1217970 RepID=UPI001C940F7E|nr:D-alanine--D-alanine ligase [Vannielia litorea]MBY6046820.1 D-alanine--D-alanine ligase [Vannielia litorea]MBY6074234.1 D-alanine--D-alanine ligase [Vannielia litorea]